MSLYPIKLLKDENQKPFIPFVPMNAIPVNGTDKTLIDLFNERYTKEEVDAIIARLGTLQRLCGRVNSKEELPSDPEPGDTYIVGAVDEDAAEYMYIGDKWERLGSMVDMTGYYTKPETDALLSTQATELETSMEDKDTVVLNAAKSYTDSEIAKVPTGVLPFIFSRYTGSSTPIQLTGLKAGTYYIEDVTYNSTITFSINYNGTIYKRSVSLTSPWDYLILNVPEDLEDTITSSSSKRYVFITVCSSVNNGSRTSYIILNTSNSSSLTTTRYENAALSKLSDVQNTADSANMTASYALSATTALDTRVTALEKGGGGGGGTSEVISVLSESMPGFWGGQIGESSKNGSVNLYCSVMGSSVYISDMSTYIQIPEGELNLTNASFVFYDSAGQELGRTTPKDMRIIAGQDYRPFETSTTVTLSSSMGVSTIKLETSGGGGSASSNLKLMDFLVSIPGGMYNNEYKFDSSKFSELKTGDRLVYNGDNQNYPQIVLKTSETGSWIASGSSFIVDVLASNVFDYDPTTQDVILRLASITFIIYVDYMSAVKKIKFNATDGSYEMHELLWNTVYS